MQHQIPRPQKKFNPVESEHTCSLKEVNLWQWHDVENIVVLAAAERPAVLNYKISNIGSLLETGNLRTVVGLNNTRNTQDKELWRSSGLEDGNI